MMKVTNIGRSTIQEYESNKMKSLLEDAGLIVGERDPNMNRNYEGKFMVAQPLEEDDPYPTDDASDGRFCLVGNDLDKLMQEALWAFDIINDTIWER